LSNRTSRQLLKNSVHKIKRLHDAGLWARIVTRRTEDRGTSLHKQLKRRNSFSIRSLWMKVGEWCFRCCWTLDTHSRHRRQIFSSWRTQIHFKFARHYDWRLFDNESERNTQLIGTRLGNFKMCDDGPCEKHLRS
jgi:hypothetical protein